MPVIGTAGHVDHGKSTLVRALTGRDPDRWEEEKRRGLTIDLGFAWTTLPSGTEVGFVDVPGHEKFIKNMLAGVDGIDVALFVVAADEGWMPQSEEHLAVLDLLGIGNGVVALTRADLVDDDLLELATLDVEEHLAGTSMEGAPIIPVAAPRNQGTAAILDALDSAIAASARPRAAERPRLWVDRAFTISGAGTVVTGTLTGGPVSVGDTMALYPGSITARVRSLQSHEESRDRVEPGSRTAINLAGLEHHSVARGGMLGAPGQWAESDRLLVDLRQVRTLDEPPANRGAYHFHFGSGAWPARLRMLTEDAGGGVALIQLEERLPVAVGDRFVLRDVGRRAVVAGGTVLDPAPVGRAPALVAAVPALRSANGSDEQAQALLDIRGSETLDRLAAMTRGGVPGDALIVDGIALASGRVQDLGIRAVTVVADYHRDNPLRPGAPKATVASTVGISIAQLEAVMTITSALIDDGATVRTPGFAGGWGDVQESEFNRARAELLASGLAVPRASALELQAEVYHALIRSERLVSIESDLVYLPEQIAEIEARLGHLDDEFTVAAFRDAMGISRRQAVPLLEWLDRTGRTVRRGDVRSVRPPPPGEPAPGDGRTR